MGISINDCFGMQHELAVEKDWIGGRIPEKAPLSLLWSIDELGEAIAIIKKKGTGAIMDNPSVRGHFVEEMADTFMYLFDAMECFGISGDEFSDAYVKKFEHNIGRSWSENRRMYEAPLFREVFFCPALLPGERMCELLLRSGCGITIVCPPDARPGISEKLECSFADDFPVSTGEDIFIVRSEEDMKELGLRLGLCSD